jgi:hypothetical protein
MASRHYCVWGLLLVQHVSPKPEYRYPRRVECEARKLAKPSEGWSPPRLGSRPKHGAYSSDVSIVANKYVSAGHAEVDGVSDTAKGAGIGGPLGGGTGQPQEQAKAVSASS